MDRQVLERFRHGDETAVRAVYERFGGPVYTVALSILGDRGLAADATQLTFVKAWQAAKTYDSNRDFAPWIYAIARRTAIDFYRRERRGPLPVADERLDMAHLPPGIDVAWEAFEVRSAVDRLTKEEREVVRLTHFFGLSHEETAERLGIAVGTVKSRTHRAHRHLASLLRHVIEEQ